MPNSLRGRAGETRKILRVRNQAVFTSIQLTACRCGWGEGLHLKYQENHCVLHEKKINRLEFLFPRSTLIERVLAKRVNSIVNGFNYIFYFYVYIHLKYG